MLKEQIVSGEILGRSTVSNASSIIEPDMVTERINGRKVKETTVNQEMVP